MHPRSLSVVLPMIAAIPLLLPAQADAASNCRSVWNKSNSKIQRFAKPLAKLVCKGIAVKTPASAQKCLDQVAQLASKADAMVKAWNEDGDSWNIGPRPLPHKRVQTGAVSTERQFVGQPVLNDNYTLTIERTGGKAKKDLVVKVCMVDDKGTDVKYKEIRLSKNGKKKHTFTFSGVAGTFPLIHLNNQRWGTNAHKYTIKGVPRGVPPKLAAARKLAGKK